MSIHIKFYYLGIWPESESFSGHGYGSIPAKWKGNCGGIPCNKYSSP
ncbi:hypothetical protein DCAR_0933252 [Daucus carota subsp. sativus]|uniref:Uncharacterized protein n=1 Tax=Daucus carota subsp. sativus TaxID=79200 RepID=A0AAF0XWI5_DAUCS|nr:hypothetical protein DCAR_0933252 [Daucus carota subsp. sativus]